MDKQIKFDPESCESRSGEYCKAYGFRKKHPNDKNLMLTFYWIVPCLFNACPLCGNVDNSEKEKL